ncbi:gluconate:proton symporter [Actinobacteria bacterium YIM 96077]|uniref:Gluconate:proton symporter n=1 Tax=Phytoactinopolyspora halophila TaxID=1981511 RepID=A0A329QKZ4_9ACTN|nr:SLC13 family permease [Phytoactinopolyspora halophila]AYY13634.1 gluconate:proton symporter [Actinobacteria bacterium YIM 96077]RAW11198.1 gluconate:proton symporter [Phytoactinopolyspora halophila]
MTSSQIVADPERVSRKQTVALGLLVVALVTAVIVNVVADELGWWGLLPVAVYAVLVVLELNVVLATGAAVVVGIVLTGAGPLEIGTMMSESLGSFIATIGLIIMLGAGLGRVASDTGAAQTLVRVLLHRVGIDSPLRIQIGIMLASTVLVGALGTLAGANAILAPIVIPVAAAVARSRTSVAAMLHAGGAAGLITGPFTPPVVTISGAAEISYTQYLFSAGLPMAVVTWVTGFLMARFIQRRTAGTEQYSELELSGLDTATAEPTRREKRAAGAFIGTIVALAVVGVILEAGFAYAIIVMIVTSIVTALAGGMRPTDALTSFYNGAAQLLWLFFLFWLFNPLLVMMEESGAYDAMLETLQPTLESLGAWPFLMLALVIGWIGVAGAAVAQVVLIDELLWPLAAPLGVTPVAWSAALLGGSQIDWFGPFPNADMIGQMGLARSSNLRMMLFNGWAIMGANLVLFALLFTVL